MAAIMIKKSCGKDPQSEQLCLAGKGIRQEKTYLGGIREIVDKTSTLVWPNSLWLNCWLMYSATVDEVIYYLPTL